MSLIKQLWLAVSLLMLMAFGVSLTITTLEAKYYLEEQLFMKNVDNANSLALSISHMSRDPVTVELQLAAQFDTGHYRRISLLDPAGAVMLERRAEDKAERVPDWFMRLIPIGAEAGRANIMDGWRQFGSLVVESQPRFAYEALWDGVLRLSGAFLLAAAASGLLGSWIIRRITRPLKDVVAQAEAIGARRFVVIDEPGTPEFRSLVRAMNGLSARVMSMLADESKRLEDLYRQTQFDPLTGVLARAPFLSRAETLLQCDPQRDDVFASGVFILIRVAPLALINKQLGREAADQLLKGLADSLSACVADEPDWIAGRLNGADFAVMAPGEDDAQRLAQHLLSRLESHVADQPVSLTVHFPTGVDSYSAGESLADILFRVDGALAQAENDEAAKPIRTAAHARDVHVMPNLNAWRAALEQSLSHERIALARYPVVDSAGRTLYQECPVRVEIGGDWQSAGIVMPWIARLGWQARLDAKVIGLVIQALKHEAGELCINISAESIASPIFRDNLIKALRQAGKLAGRLWIDVPEAGAFRHMEAFRHLCIALQPLGCKIGIEHVGKSFSRIGEMYDIGLSYIKIDASLVRDAHLKPGNQACLRGLIMVAHAIGVQAIAEGVASSGESDALFALGTDGVTGPGVSARAKSVDVPASS